MSEFEEWKKANDDSWCGLFTHEIAEMAFEAGRTSMRAERDKLREALWVCVEHNRLHFGERHNTVIQGNKALEETTEEINKYGSLDGLLEETT